jgi:hypothetical protein
MYGYDAIGVEIDGKDVEAYKLFLQTWLKRKRLKHTAELVPVRRQGNRAARRLEVTMAASKDDHKAGAVQKVTVLQADTTQLDGLLRGGVADVLVTDLPYGVRTAATTTRAACPGRSTAGAGRAAVVALLRPGRARAVLEPQGAGGSWPRTSWSRTPGDRRVRAWRTGRPGHRARRRGGPETADCRTPAYLLAMVYRDRVFDLLLAGTRARSSRNAPTVRPIIAMLRKYEVSVAEVGDHDVHGRAQIGVAVVAAEPPRRAPVIDTCEHQVAAGRRSNSSR